MFVVDRQVYKTKERLLFTLSIRHLIKTNNYTQTCLSKDTNNSTQLWCKILSKCQSFWVKRNNWESNPERAKNASDTNPTALSLNEKSKKNLVPRDLTSPHTNQERLRRIARASPSTLRYTSILLPSIAIAQFISVFHPADSCAS